MLISLHIIQTSRDHIPWSCQLSSERSLVRLRNVAVAREDNQQYVGDPECQAVYGDASADLYVENMQIGRLANVHFGEYI
jgi:hypothetical protein